MDVLFVVQSAVVYPQPSRKAVVVVSRNPVSTFVGTGFLFIFHLRKMLFMLEFKLI